VIFLGYVLTGLVSGAIFAVMASGLTLSYAATGVFNFAHGATAFLAAFVFFELNTGLHWPAWIAAIVVIGVVAPLIGYLLHWAMFRGLAQAGETAQIVATIGLTIALPAVAMWVVERLVTDGGVHIPLGTDQVAVPGLGPSPAASWRLFGSVALDSNQVAAFVAAVLVAAGLWVLLRRTRLGLTMRAAVSARGLASLRGVDVDRCSALAWMLSSGLAGLAGVLAAPFLGLDSGAFTLLLFTSATAAVIGRLRSIPITFGAGLALGVVQNLAGSYAGFARSITGFRTSVPVLLLFAGLLWLNRSRSTGSVATDSPPPDYLSDLVWWRRFLPWALGVFVLLGWTFTVGSGFWVGLVAQGLALGLVFCSFVVLTGIGGMVNLAQATFVAMAALTTGWAFHHGVPFVEAVVLGVLAASLVGVVVALPALRLGGRVLALATLALALLCDQVLFQVSSFSNGTLGWTLPGVSLGFATLNDPRVRVVFLLVLLGLIGLVIRNLEHSSSGRAMLAVRSAPAAAMTSGISATRTKITLFALASAIAGLGGILLAVSAGRITATDFPAFTGFLWLAAVVLQGVRRIGGAVLAGMVVAVFPELLSSYVTSSVYVASALFGLGGVILAKHPDGILAQFAEVRYRRRRASVRASVRVLPDDLPDRPSAGDGVLRLEGVVAGYGDATVLRGVDLVVPAGKVVALLGANGAGKSTVCAAAAGSLSLTAGRVLLDGGDVTAATCHHRARAGILLAPEGRGVFPALTVEENLAVWLRTVAEREQVYERLPRLAERRQVAAGSLSGGEQQMLALAPALVTPPKVLIADEPSLGLAPRVVDQVFEIFGELRDRGVALLVVEEKASEILRLADTVAFMRLGRIDWTGPRADVDTDRLTAAYLGISA
jgi:ABC-type branched-subunit amino acid transport system ATPase component/branched-subunit amino acid ABC-type transport system permease component